MERKFLVKDDRWRQEITETLILRQGYLMTDPHCTVRVRASNSSAWLTIKGKNAGGATPEFEYPIPKDDAATMLEQLAHRPLVEKKRHMVPYGGFLWEVDEFFGANAGLIIAEIELASLDQPFPRPPWVGAEVTGELQYYNSSLVARPFSQWELS